MSNKALRILIADEQHLQRMSIERLFNHLGYYRIAPVQHFTDLLNLVDHACVAFDLLVINADLASGQAETLAVLFDHPQVRHLFIYNWPHGQCPPALADSQRVWISQLPLPDLNAIQPLTERVGGPLPFVATVISVR